MTDLFWTVEVGSKHLPEHWKWETQSLDEAVYFLQCVTCTRGWLCVCVHLSPRTGYPGGTVVGSALLCVCGPARPLAGRRCQSLHFTSGVELPTGDPSLFPAAAAWGRALRPLWYHPTENTDRCVKINMALHMKLLYKKYTWLLGLDHVRASSQLYTSITGYTLTVYFNLCSG